MLWDRLLYGCTFIAYTPLLWSLHSRRRRRANIMRNCVTYELRCQGHSALLSRSSLTKRPLFIDCGCINLRQCCVRSKYQPPTFAAHVVELRILMLALSKLLQSTTVTYIRGLCLANITVVTAPCCLFSTCTAKWRTINHPPSTTKERFRRLPLWWRRVCVVHIRDLIYCSLIVPNGWITSHSFN